MLLFLSASFFPQNDITNEVVTLMKSGNSKALSEHFAPKVDLAVPETDDVFSRAQAELILKKFFAAHPPTNMTVVHSGTSKLGVQYRICNLTTKNGVYRVSFNMKNTSNKLYIQQLRIEEDTDNF